MCDALSSFPPATGDTERARPPTVAEVLAGASDECLNMEFLRALAIQQAMLRSASPRYPRGNKLQAALYLNVLRPTFHHWLDRGWGEIGQRFERIPPCDRRLFVNVSDLSWPNIRQEAVRQALLRAKGYQTRAARLLGTNRQMVGEMMKRFSDFPSRAQFASEEGDK